MYVCIPDVWYQYSPWGLYYITRVSPDGLCKFRHMQITYHSLTHVQLQANVHLNISC